ncbi:MAG: TIR domain-containing protein [Egibacteraceae bacterium]
MVRALPFDVFLSYNRADESALEQLAKRLRDEGIQPWLDLWCLVPGDAWQPQIVQGLNASKACAVFVGPHGLGDWAREELAVAQDRAAKDRDFRLFMVLLPGALQPDDPSLAFLATRTWLDLRAGIDNPAGIRDLVSAVSGVARRPVVLSGTGDEVCPYRGLEVFDETHAEFFFGRDDDAKRMLEKLRGSRFLAVLGPSGSGKSSLVRAGVIPALRQGALPGSEAWMIRVLTPGARPTSMLAAQLVRLFASEGMQRTLDGLLADERSLDLAVSLALAERPRDERVVLVVDQFEEVFTLCQDEEERTAFLANLCYGATIPGGRLVVLLAMRADFYHRCAAYPELRALATQQFLVGPLGSHALRHVIELPAWRVGLELEPGLVETILDDVADRPGTLPLLEHVLLEVWQRRQGRKLTLEAYVASGGVEGALAQRANTIYNGLSPTQQQIARRVLLRLIQPGEGTEDTRRRAVVGELLTRSEEQADVQTVVNALADGRLLITGQDDVVGNEVVDVAHEALIRGWPTLRGWINEDREALRAQRRLTEAATEWDENGREDGYLYRGARLLGWQDRPVSGLNDLERAFLDASRGREAREHATARRRVRLTLIGLSGALTVITIFAVVALLASLRAIRQRDLAESARLAASANQLLSIDPEQSLLLALEAYETRPNEAAETILRQAMLESRLSARYDHESAVYGVSVSQDGRIASAGNDGTIHIWNPAGGEPAILSGHEDRIRGIDFSPDGQRVASASEDGTVRVWDAAGGAQVTELRRESRMYAVAFSPDGQRIASAGSGGAVQVADLAGNTIVEVSGRGSAVLGIAFSADGTRIAAAGADNTVRMWDTASGAELLALANPGDMWGVAFSPDGRWIAGAGEGGTVRVWDAASGAELMMLPGYGGRVYGVAFSCDGRQIAASGADGTVRVWDQTGHVVEAFGGHRGRVYGVAFSCDRQQIVSGGADGTVRVWDHGDSTLLALPGRRGRVESVAFSSDGRRIASGGTDGTVSVWDLTGSDPVALPGHEGTVYSLAFSRDGQRIASGGADGMVRVWDLASNALLGSFPGHAGRVYGIAFSPDGERVLSAGQDGRVRLWDLAGGVELRELVGHDRHVYDVAFSSDGERIVTAGGDGTVRVWDAADGQEQRKLQGHRGAVLSVAFSQDGQRVASTGTDGMVALWDLTSDDDAPSRTLPGHDDEVAAVAFRPDGQQIASAGLDGTVRVWNLAGGGSVLLRGYEDDVIAVAFRPDGQRLASASTDGLVRAWECEVCGPIEEVLALARERATYLNELEGS